MFLLLKMSAFYALYMAPNVAVLLINDFLLFVTII